MVEFRYNGVVYIFDESELLAVLPAEVLRRWISSRPGYQAAYRGCRHESMDPVRGP